MDNPYAPTRPAAPDPSPLGGRAQDCRPADSGASDWRIFAFAAWPVLLVLNSSVPLLLGSRMIQEHGKWGVALAVLLFATGGWVICARWPWLRSRLLSGAGILALTQVFPLLQIIAGVIALKIAVRFGQARVASDFAPDRIHSELGGFVVTAITGGILFCAAVVIGWMAVGILCAVHSPGDVHQPAERSS